MNTTNKPADITINNPIENGRWVNGRMVNGRVVNGRVVNGHVGWGFGHKHMVDDHQGYSWAGTEIPKTVFEISVKSVNLTSLEKKWLLPGDRIPDVGFRVARVPADELVKQPTGARHSFRAYQGVWQIKYTNGATRVYSIDATGFVVFPSDHLNGKLVAKDGDTLLDFRNGQLERMKVVGRTLHIDHFNPASNYPKSITWHGVGVLSQ